MVGFGGGVGRNAGYWGPERRGGRWDLGLGGLADWAAGRRGDAKHSNRREGYARGIGKAE